MFYSINNFKNKINRIKNQLSEANYFSRFFFAYKLSKIMYIFESDKVVQCLVLHTFVNNFSVMKLLKNNQSLSISDESLKHCLKVASTQNIRPDIDLIIATKIYQPSH